MNRNNTRNKILHLYFMHVEIAVNNKKTKLIDLTLQKKSNKEHSVFHEKKLGKSGWEKRKFSSSALEQMHQTNNIPEKKSQPAGTSQRRASHHTQN